MVDENVLQLVARPEPEPELTESAVTTTDYLNGVEVEKEDGNVRLTFWEKVWSYKEKERRIVHRIVIPERMTECGGVLLADALNALSAELKRVTQ